jgi:toxin ParE1/3/4
MAKLIWTEKAISSLEDIYDYIAADSPFYARFQIEKILEAVERLVGRLRHRVNPNE